MVHEVDLPSPTWEVSDHDGFLEMYDATVVEVFRYACRLTSDTPRAEDLVQQVYLELLESARSGAVGRIGMGRLIVAVRSRFLNALRGTAREERRLRLVVSNPNPEPADEFAGTDLLDDHGLTDRERAALTLRYVDDLSVADVASALETTVRATESLLARARNRIRNREARHA